MLGMAEVDMVDVSNLHLHVFTDCSILNGSKVVEMFLQCLSASGNVCPLGGHLGDAPVLLFSIVQDQTSIYLSGERSRKQKWTDKMTFLNTDMKGAVKV